MSIILAGKQRATSPVLIVQPFRTQLKIRLIAVHTSRARTELLIQFQMPNEKLHAKQFLRVTLQIDFNFRFR